MTEIAIGCIVLLNLNPGQESAAIVTHVFGPEQGMINCRAFPDGNAPMSWLTSVPHFTHAEAGAISWRFHFEERDDGVRDEGDQPERSSAGVG